MHSKCSSSVLALACGLILFTSAPLRADPLDLNAEVALDIPAQSLESALLDLSKQAAFQLVISAPSVPAQQARSVSGKMSIRNALDLLLRDTGLRYKWVGEHTVAVMANDMASAGQRLETRGDEPTPESIEEIVVTGSHIRGVEPIGSALITITREDIVASGHGRVQDLLEMLPQNFQGSASEDVIVDQGSANSTRGQAIDLRGLGASATLVLVNGRRQPQGGLEGSFVDISSIAATAIERIEVLPEGASAIYGSDAIGGVVNFVLRKDYEGWEIGGRAGTYDGNADEYRASTLWGTRWDSGNVLLGYQYQLREALMQADTTYGRLGQDYRSLGGTDFRSAYANPGTILNASFQPAFAIPAGQDGSDLGVDALTPGRNAADTVSNSAWLPEQELHGAFFNVTQRLTDRIELFADGRYATRDMVLPNGGYISPVTVPNSNPFYVNPFGGTGPVNVAYNFSDDLGPLVQSSTTDTWAASAGATARLGDEWTVNAAVSYGREDNDWMWNNTVNFAALATAAADLNPATAFNPFGDGSHTNPVTIASIRQHTRGSGRYTVGMFSLIADGPIFSLPSGAVRLAVGVDYRDEDLRAQRSNIMPATGVVTPISLAAGTLDREVKAAFAEMVIPLLDSVDENGTPRIALSLAGRAEDYGDFGSTFDPKVGINVVPMNGLKLRGSWGSSFRAPRFNELSPAANPSGSGTQRNAPDPLSPTGFADFLFLRGNNPDIHEETAKIWTTGFDFVPTALPGLSLAATYFSIDYEDKIATGGSGINTLLNEAQWVEIITRNPTPDQVAAICNRSDFQGTCPTAPAAIVDTRLRNLAELRVTGIDLDIGYGTGLGAGRVNFGVAGSYMLSYERAVGPDSPFVDVLGSVGNPLDLRLRGRLGWSLGGWRINGFVNHIGDSTAPSSGRKIASWTTADLNVGYQFQDAGWASGTRIQLSVINAFDKAPPFVVNQLVGFDAANTNDNGRIVAIDLTKSW